MSKSADKTSSNPSSAALLALLTLAVAASLLALFQWMELLIAQQGGGTFCGVSETLNCEAVWSSNFAKSIHKLTNLPLAGWGLVWGVTAFFVSAHLLYDVLGRRGYDGRIFAVRMVGLGGVGAVVVFFGASMQLGQFCLTCLTTYAFVLVFAFLSFRIKPLRPLRDVHLVSTALPVAASLAVSYAALLIPGSRTPVDTKLGLSLPAKAAVEPPAPTKAPAAKPAPPPSPLAQYLASLPPPAAQAVSNSIEQLRKSKTPDVSAFVTRHRIGPEIAPVRIVDFSDIRCGHCRHLNEVIAQLVEAAPPGSFSSEARFFPLDGKCNPQVPPTLTDETGVRCLAPQVLVCIEDDPNYHKARDIMFSEQQTLTKDRVYEIAVQATGRSKSVIGKCAKSAATKKKIDEDIAYASKYDIHGTPVVVINGRQATGVAPFLYAMIIAGGNFENPAFATLPPPQADAHVH